MSPFSHLQNEAGAHCRGHCKDHATGRPLKPVPGRQRVPRQGCSHGGPRRPGQVGWGRQRQEPLRAVLGAAGGGQRGEERAPPASLLFPAARPGPEAEAAGGVLIPGGPAASDALGLFWGTRV